MVKKPRHLLGLSFLPASGRRAFGLSRIVAATPDIATLASRLRDGDRATLARAITLIESKRADHRKPAHQLVQALLPQPARPIRVGITGAPGVGKCTTIDALGSI